MRLWRVRFRALRAADKCLLMKPNTFQHHREPASLRFDSVRNHRRMPFGFPPERAFSFIGIPIAICWFGTVNAWRPDNTRIV